MVNNMNLTNELKSFLLKNGADKIGFANLKSLDKKIRDNYDYGIVIGLKYSKEAIVNNKNEDLEKYYDEFKLINEKLDNLANSTEEFLEKKGFPSLANLRATVQIDKNYSSKLPHKTLATLAGIGWIGKCGLLVTNDFGSAIRFISILTNAELDCGKPIETSQCPYTCNNCGNVCPGNAISGRLWMKGIDRDAFYNADACKKAATKLAKEKLNVEESICGLCISNCPITQKAMKY